MGIGFSISALTSSIVVSLVRRLLVWEGVLELLLPRGVLAERESLGTLTRGIQANEVLRDLMHMLLRLRLGLRPIRPAELVELGNLSTDVLAHLIELVGGYEQLVRRRIALARRVFDDQVLAGGWFLPEPVVRWRISMNRPMPCCSCTTKSPGFNSIRSMDLRRFRAVLTPAATLVRPVRSRSVSNAVFDACR